MDPMATVASEAISAPSSAEGTKPDAPNDSQGSPPNIIITVAAAPFDNSFADADAILRSADGANFYVHKNILRIASAFFADMFSLPQPPQAASPVDGDTATDASSHSANTLPVIPVSEDRQSFDKLLRMCYPVEKPTFASVQEISPIIEGALKYQMREATSALTKELIIFSDSHPLDVYAEACRRGLEEVVSRAAAAFAAPLIKIKKIRYDTPAYAIDAFTPHMENISAASYFHLLEYHSTRSADSLAAKHSPNTTEDGTTSRPVPSHPFDDPAPADTIIRSSDGIDFYVLRYLVGFSSPVLASMLSGEGSSNPGAPATSPLRNRLIDLPEDGRTLALLFQLCYPMPDPEVQDGSADEKLCGACRLLEAAKKYEVARAAVFAKRECVAAVAAYPVRLYFVASRYGWEDVMKDAAWRSVYETSDQYVREMATASAAAYRRLLGAKSAQREGEDAPSSYWSRDSWLDAIHRFVREEAAAGREPRLQPDAVLPRSIIPSDHTSPEVTCSTDAFGTPAVKQGGRGLSVNRTRQLHSTISSSPAPSPNSWTVSRQIVIDIANALAK
ncbi:uncharacterized protein B0H18DRAFT_1020410, partial [Fomitopsis serialis]|uniref:uncharacterized protein n=1 Tax=Fomitopsis serialis TaxID=139415 RepID=UPI0020086980